MSSVNQGPCWDTGDSLGWGKAQGRAETSAHWTTSLWKASPCHNILKEQVGHHAATVCQATAPQASQGSVTCQATRPTPHRTARLPPHGPTGPPLASPPGYHLPAHWPLPTTGGLKHHQTLAPNLPRRCRQTGLDAKGVTPEQLRLKFCSWTRNFFSFFFFLFSLSVYLSCSLSDCPPYLPVDFLGCPFFFPFPSFSFFSFFLGIVSFTIIS
jgi:hypothetical protein